jgi:hypothetical protein
MYGSMKLCTDKQAKTRALEETSRRTRDLDGELDEQLRRKDEELEIYKTGLDSTLLELKELQLVRHVEGYANDRRTAKATKPSTAKSTISSRNTSKS